MLIEPLEGRRLLSATVAEMARDGEIAELARSKPGAVAAIARPDDAGPPGGGGDAAVTSAASRGGQSNFPPGQFPAGNPGQAPGNSNSPGNSGR